MQDPGLPLPSGAFPPMEGSPQRSQQKKKNDLARVDSCLAACNDAFAAVDAAGSATRSAAGQARVALQSSGIASRGSVARDLAVTSATRDADDLTWKLSAWKQMAGALYGDTPPVAMLTVTVLAGTALPTSSPSWIAHVAGSTAETGLPSSFQKTAGAIPAPSWSGEPLTLPCHDLAADLCLLLCEPAPDLPSGRRCVGRAFVPITSLLPLNPFGTPRPLQAWCTIFPPAAEHASDCVHSSLAASVPGIPGLGMKPSANGVLAKALLNVQLKYNRAAVGCCGLTPVVGVYLFSPPFDAAAVPSIDQHTSLPATPPEEIQRVLYRLGSSLRPPALLRLALLQPVLGLPPILLLLFWLSYFCPLPVLPWWLLSAWLLNGFALAWERCAACAILCTPVR